MSENDIMRIDGKADEISAELKKKYGYTKKQAEKNVDDFLSKF